MIILPIPNSGDRWSPDSPLWHSRGYAGLTIDQPDLTGILLSVLFFHFISAHWQGQKDKYLYHTHVIDIVPGFSFADAHDLNYWPVSNGQLPPKQCQISTGPEYSGAKLIRI
jgi:hypothetical protein